MTSKPKSEQEFTDYLLEKLAGLPITITSPEPLAIDLNYGENEPSLTIKLESIFDEYKQEPDKIDVLMQPFVTELGWTVAEPRRSGREVAMNSMPLMRDLMRAPLADDESGSPKGPLVYQELVDRPEERVVVQFVLHKEDMPIIALHTGDILPVFPNTREVAGASVQNLRQLVIDTGLTLSEFPVENFGTKPWLVGFRNTDLAPFVASLVIVPEVMKTLEATLDAPEGLLATIPSRDRLLLTTDTDDKAVCEMGLLAQYLKQQAADPVSAFIWRFKGGVLERVQTVELQEQGDSP